MSIHNLKINEENKKKIKNTCKNYHKNYVISEELEKERK